MVEDIVGKMCKPVHFAQNIIADARMFLNLQALCFGKTARFEQHGLGDAYFSDVVQKSGRGKIIQLV